MLEVKLSNKFKSIADDTDHTFNFVKQNDTDELCGQAVAFLSILLFK